MMNFKTKLGEDGRVLLPAKCRKALHLKPGEELILHIENEELHLYSLKHSLKKLQDIVQKRSKGQSLVKKLKEMREEDAANED